MFLLASFSYSAFAQLTSSLSVEKIMQDPKWIGTAPDGIFWDINSQKLYFNWNPEAEDLPAVYQIAVKSNNSPAKLSTNDQKSLIRQYVTDRAGKRILYVKSGDIYIQELASGQEKRLTYTAANESNPRFGAGEKNVIFMQGDNFFALALDNNELVQLTNFTRSAPGSRGGNNRGAMSETEQNAWLKNDQLELFDVLKENKHMDSLRRSRMEELRAEPDPALKAIVLGEGRLSNQQISPDLRYVSYSLTTTPEGNKTTIVPNYVTESGYTEDLQTRTKVGNFLPVSKSYIHDRNTGTTVELQTSTIPGIKDIPEYFNDYPEKKAELLKQNEDRHVTLSSPVWNENGTAAVVIGTAADNKDRWILRLHPEDGSLSLIDRQRDEAWIGGPGIRGWGGGLGWIDENTFYFQSEATGYSHLYTANIQTGQKKQLTEGKWEVQSLQLSADRKHFYLKANKEHPGITHFYKLSINGGNLVQLTSMTGGNEVTLSPDEKWLAIRYSYSNKPWELFLQENKPGAKAVQITESLTDEFKSYDWRVPEVISFKNRHGDDVYARIFQPEQAKEGNPAVIFVHGAGYLQNVHYWWSQYFREYMFHNLLTDLGYTVLDIDYTASSGYGRDHRTGIYRHMGGKDLSDQVDGAKLLVEKYGVNSKNIGLYGGSYGGFITLMALFNEPEVFAAGAALRSVTDWAHYNHGYTANILNEPVNDPIAYQRSSPIYFADGLKGHLLMAHGMVDVNVHFQDIVRLSQRLIELGKDNWELAVYPVEDHGFVTPSSWTDEYKRILKLFEERLTN